MSLMMNHMNVIEGLRMEEEKAVRYLYDTHYRGLCYYADLILQNKLEAEDVATESFIKLLKKKETFSSLPEIKAFLFKATKNACIDILRKNKIAGKYRAAQENVMHVEAHPLIDDYEMTMAQLLQAIYTEVEQLPSQCRSVFKSIYMDGKNTAEVAALMSISPQTVLNQKNKAIRILRLLLYKQGLPTNLAIIYTALLLLRRY